MEKTDFDSPKSVDRKTIEKNRRTHMKILCSQLCSLLPNNQNSSKELMPLSDQLDETTNYIKKMEENLEIMKKKKESLTGIQKITKRMGCGMNVELKVIKPPQLEIRNIGSILELVLISGTENSSTIFYNIINILKEEGAEILNANFSVVNDSTFYTIYSEVGELEPRISWRLNQFINEIVQ